MDATNAAPKAVATSEDISAAPSELAQCLYDLQPEQLVSLKVGEDFNHCIFATLVELPNRVSPDVRG
jgi:hypothetical protein